MFGNNEIPAVNLAGVFLKWSCLSQSQTKNQENVWFLELIR